MDIIGTVFLTVNIITYYNNKKKIVDMITTTITLTIDTEKTVNVGYIYVTLNT